jgi:hypothetical protein
VGKTKVVKAIAELTKRSLFVVKLEHILSVQMLTRLFHNPNESFNQVLLPFFAARAPRSVSRALSLFLSHSLHPSPFLCIRPWQQCRCCYHWTSEFIISQSLTSKVRCVFLAWA